MAAPQLRLTTADEAIGMRLLRIAEDMNSPSRHHGRCDRLIADVEQAAQDLRATVRGRVTARPLTDAVRR
jgi:hypothetical protein